MMFFLFMSLSLCESQQRSMNGISHQFSLLRSMRHLPQKDHFVWLIVVGLWQFGASQPASCLHLQHCWLGVLARQQNCAVNLFLGHVRSLSQQSKHKLCLHAKSFLNKLENHFVTNTSSNCSQIKANKLFVFNSFNHKRKKFLYIFCCFVNKFFLKKNLKKKKRKEKEIERKIKCIINFNIISTIKIEIKLKISNEEN